MGFRVIPDYPSSRPTEQVDLRNHVEIVGRTEPPSVVPQSDRETALANQASQQLWIKLKSKLTLAALAAVVSMAFFLYMGDMHSKRDSAIASSSTSPLSAASTVTTDQEAFGPSSLAEKKTVKSYGFDALMEAKESVVVNEARTLSYFTEPRLNNESEFTPITTFKDPRNKSGLTTHLRPIPGNSGRYRSSANKLEWQGGWESRNPVANAKRASDYLKYLEGKGLTSDLKLFDRSAGKLSKEISVLPKTSERILFHEK